MRHEQQSINFPMLPFRICNLDKSGAKNAVSDKRSDALHTATGHSDLEEVMHRHCNAESGTIMHVDGAAALSCC